MGRFRFESALVTGAARGIGLATARAFARRGARVVLWDLDGEALERAVEDLRSGGLRAEGQRVDVSDRQAVLAAAREALDRLGSLDVLVNNAGVGAHGELYRTSPETWERLLAVNLWGVINGVDAFLPHMLERGRGHVVNVSTGQVFHRLPSWGAYTAVKTAVAVYSEVLRFELLGTGVRVTTVFPFLVNTGFYDPVRAERDDTWVSRLAIRALPLYADSPERVARRILRAVERGRPVETVNPLNDLGRVARRLPVLSEALGRFYALLLTRRPEVGRGR